MNEHYDEATLADYLDGPEAFAEREALERHLAACRDCRDLLDDLKELEAALQSGEMWDAAEALSSERDAPESISSLAAALAREEEQAAQRLARIIDSPIMFRRARVMERAELHNAGAVRFLCARSRELREKQPMHALTLADAAVALSDRLPRERYPSTMIADLRGSAWLERANALRLLGRFAEALDALDIAERAYAHTPVATFSLALVQYLRAVIFFESERLDEATQLARRAARVFRQFGEDERFLHAKIVEGGVLFHRNRFAEALELFMSLVGPAKSLGDAATIARLYGNIANCYLGLQRRSDACGYFAQALSLYEALGFETEKIRTRWSLGRLAIAAGKAAEGVNRLREAQREFEAIGLTNEAAQVTLDVVEALLATGETAEVARLCAGLVESFTAAGMTGNSLTALAYLREAVASGRADHDLLEHVRAYLAAGPENTD
ncbi:MAG TPA: zf-HC2 domain-containing protein, partial [Thermoanaerobaculia bacterium]|nr:zf-HC2 domain-containing protein [Thermoanaerobaculia bacterium]